jgi:VWFA-related protein
MTELERFSLLLCLAAAGLSAQQSDAGQAVISVRSTVVQVPTLVKSKGGQVMLKLTADDFVLTDNGVPQTLSLDLGSDLEPLALAIVVETGGAGAQHLAQYQQLDAILDALVGAVEHRVAVIGFDSKPHLLRPFETGTDRASQQLANLREGDQGSAILDGVVFAEAQLQAQPARFRRAILLISETIDHGSKATLSEALRLISDTNTTMYSFGFSSTRAAIAHEASKFGNKASATGSGVELESTEQGPAHGCFSKVGADAEYEGHYSKQVLDCISQLAPPLRLATMAFLGARNALRTNAAEAVAQLTGGEFFHFHDEKDLKAGLIAASNDVPNYYLLSFRPTALTPGLHALHLEVKNLPRSDASHLVIKSRSEYWMDSDK